MTTFWVAIATSATIVASWLMTNLWISCKRRVALKRFLREPVGVYNVGYTMPSNHTQEEP